MSASAASPCAESQPVSQGTRVGWARTATPPAAWMVVMISAMVSALGRTGFQCTSMAAIAAEESRACPFVHQRVHQLHQTRVTRVLCEHFIQRNRIAGRRQKSAAGVDPSMDISQRCLFHRAEACILQIETIPQNIDVRLSWWRIARIPATGELNRWQHGNPTLLGHRDSFTCTLRCVMAVMAMVRRPMDAAWATSSRGDARPSE